MSTTVIWTYLKLLHFLAANILTASFHFYKAYISWVYEAIEAQQEFTIKEGPSENDSGCQPPCMQTSANIAWMNQHEYILSWTIKERMQLHIMC